MTHKRIDIALVERDFFSSRSKAQMAIEDRVVHVNKTLVLKPSFLVEDTDDITIEGETLKYVSRGGLKLEKAIELFNLSLKDVRAMDIGASTGGFTDCMLQNGAQMVYAVDVGSDQLCESLKASDQVVDMSQTNIRDLKLSDLKAPLDFISIDVSFIPLHLVLPVAKQLLKEDGEMIALIKPQFEIGKHKGLKKGIVKDPKDHVMVLKTLINTFEDNGFSWKGLTYSPVKGPKGNLEFLAYVKKDKHGSCHFDNTTLKDLVKEAHEHLK